MTGGRPGRDPGVPPQRHTLPVWVQVLVSPPREGKGDGGDEAGEKQFFFLMGRLGSSQLAVAAHFF